MEWLVVTGEPRAQFRGEGLLNGEEFCKFEVRAWDGSPGGADAFSLKLHGCDGPVKDRYYLEVQGHDSEGQSRLNKLVMDLARDLNMPVVRVFSGLLLLRAQYPDIPVMIISAVEDGTVVRRAFELGAAGYLHKSAGPTQIRRAIETVLSGEVFVPSGLSLSSEDEQTNLMRRLATLTPQQVRVLMMLSDGLMNKQIAYELSISEATVKAHVSAILQKLNVDSRTQAVIAASKIEQGQFAQLVEATDQA
jgi:DNA-binding NarL/FixJ family response regulator